MVTKREAEGNMKMLVKMKIFFRTRRNFQSFPEGKTTGELFPSSSSSDSLVVSISKSDIEGQKNELTGTHINEIENHFFQIYRTTVIAVERGARILYSTFLQTENNSLSFNYLIYALIYI